MNKLYELIKVLHDKTGLNIIKYNNVRHKPKYDYITYKATANDIEEAITEKEYKDQQRIYKMDYFANVSFISVSDNEQDAFNNAQKLKDTIFMIEEELSSQHNIVILNVNDIMDVSILEINENEYRYNLDIRYRTSRELRQNVGQVEDYKINLGGNV